MIMEAFQTKSEETWDWVQNGNDQGMYQVFGYGYPNIVLHRKMSQRMTNQNLYI